jgi:hypothetical protein
MPVFSEGKFEGFPVGWQSLNRLPSGVRSRGRRGDPPPAVLGKVDWDQARKDWRTAAYVALLEAKVPRHLGRIELQIEMRFPDRAHRDTGNFEPTLKPIIDALGGKRLYRSKATTKNYGIVYEPGREIIPDDTPRCLVRTNATIGEPLGRNNPIKGIVVLTIRRLPMEAAA